MFATALGGPDDARIGLLAAFQIASKLRIIERMAEEAGTPFRQRFLRLHPRNESSEVLADERPQGQVRSVLHQKAWLYCRVQEGGEERMITRFDLVRHWHP